jgi:hypothetical protein
MPKGYYADARRLSRLWRHRNLNCRFETIRSAPISQIFSNNAAGARTLLQLGCRPVNHLEIVVQRARTPGVQCGAVEGAAKDSVSKEGQPERLEPPNLSKLYAASAATFPHDAPVIQRQHVDAGPRLQIFNFRHRVIHRIGSRRYFTRCRNLRDSAHQGEPPKKRRSSTP